MGKRRSFAAPFPQLNHNRKSHSEQSEESLNFKQKAIKFNKYLVLKPELKFLLFVVISGVNCGSVDYGIGIGYQINWDVFQDSFHLVTNDEVFVEFFPVDELL